MSKKKERHKQKLFTREIAKFAEKMLEETKDEKLIDYALPFPIQCEKINKGEIDDKKRV